MSLRLSLGRNCTNGTISLAGRVSIEICLKRTKNKGKCTIMAFKICFFEVNFFLREFLRGFRCVLFQFWLANGGPQCPVLPFFLFALNQYWHHTNNFLTRTIDGITMFVVWRFYSVLLTAFLFVCFGVFSSSFYFYNLFVSLCVCLHVCVCACACVCVYKYVCVHVCVWERKSTWVCFSFL